MSRTFTAALCALSLFVAPSAIAASYVGDVQPILEAKCSGCHTAGGSNGGHNIGDTYSDASGASYHCEGENIAECSIARIKDGSMPAYPGCGGVVADDAPDAGQCITESEMAVLEAWADAGLPEQACEPATDCGDVTCGSIDDGCGGALACGECAEGSTCTDGSCVEDCVPSQDCGDATCGPVDDGCGGSIECGECPEGQGCDQGTCVEGCVPATCAEGACGDSDDGCGGTIACGECAAGSTCTDGMCVEDCVPMSCGERGCGDMDDGCGGTTSCGDCAEGSTCTEGMCVEDCVPADGCGDVTCGGMDDGCGGTLVCGECAEGETCTDGACVADEEPEPVTTGPDYVNDVQPILEAKCAACHTTGASGGHSIGMNHADGLDASYSCTDKNIAACSVDRIKDGTMPQGKGCEGVVADGAPNADVCVTESEMAILEAWLEAGTPEEVSAGGGAGDGADDGGDTDPTPGTGDEAPADGESETAEDEADEGGCQSTQGSLGWLMLALAGLLLITSRRRSVFDQ